jgi:IS30 family transposase
VVNIEDDMAAIGIGRSRAQQLERRRQRIEMVHELAAAKKKIGGAEIARRLAVSPSTVYRDLRRGRRRRRGPGAILPPNTVLNNASNEPCRRARCTTRDGAKPRSRLVTA